MTGPRITEALIEATRLARSDLEQEIEGLEILNEVLSVDRSDEDLIEALLASRYWGW